MSTTPEPTDDFEAAKSVFEKLKDLSRERQERVLRWVAEGLGVSNPTALPPSHPPPAQPQPAPAPSDQGPTDIKSFAAAKNPRSDQQFVTVVAYYYRFEAPPAQRKEAIDGKVVQEAARLVGRERLTNPKATLNNAKHSGYLDGAARGEFSINTVGENLVAMTLPGDGSTATVSKKKKRKTPRKTTKRR